jgi:superfamily I DNA and RNA helicase
MTLEVVYGESRNRPVAKALAAQLRSVIDEGTIYLGYPVLATADEKIEVDALLVTRSHGLVAFLIGKNIPASDEEWDSFRDEQDRLYTVLSGSLRRHEGLRLGRHLALDPQTATVFSAPVTPAFSESDGFFGALEDVPDWVSGLPGIGASVERSLHAALQRVTTIKPAKKRAGVEKLSSRGAVMKEIEKGIANLDSWQKSAAIESPEGPQRIRGLAGSGKTVVLALKAAYWHGHNPDWRIAVTFHSRALYQQIDDLVTRFCFEQSNDKPDPDFLKILHSWGSRSRPGIYSMIARALGEQPLDWVTARDKYGMDGAFQGACQELLVIAKNKSFNPIFDAVLVDEAQDLPPEFFQLLYLFTSDPKRIVWGYDELQKLSEAVMPDTDELFGTGPNGESLVSLAAAPDSPRRDIVLPICYRNSPWALATAHALGSGVYRKEGLLQHPDDPLLWRDIGYNVVHGELVPGSRVTLQRARENSPDYFHNLLTPEDAVVVQPFKTEEEQDAWVADQIKINLTDDELEEDDILVVLPDTYRAKSRAPRLMREMRARGIPCHLVGVGTSVDEVFQSGSVALAHIYRAKGNEAPMVYVIDAQHAAADFNAVTRRNTLFTAITRSRAWVRVTGWGPNMGVIESEAAAVADNHFKLDFKIPTSDELRDMRHQHRDRPEESEESVRRATEGVEAFLQAIDRGEMDILDLPPAVRTKLVTSIQGDASIGDD